MDHRREGGVTFDQTPSDVQVHATEFPPGSRKPDQLDMTEITLGPEQRELAQSTTKSPTTLPGEPTDQSGSRSDHLATRIGSRMFCPTKRGNLRGQRLARGLRCCRWSMVELRCLETEYSPMESECLLENCQHGQPICHRPSICERPPSRTDKDSSADIRVPPTTQDILHGDTSHVIDTRHVFVTIPPREPNPESCETQPNHTPIKPTNSTSSISTSSSSTSLSSTASSSSSSSNKKSDEESGTAVAGDANGDQGPTAPGDTCSIEMADEGGSDGADEFKSFLPQMVFSCVAFWFCGFILGLIGFVLAGKQ